MQTKSSNYGSLQFRREFALSFMDEIFMNLVSSFSDRIQTGFTTQLPSTTPDETWRKIRHALLGNSTHTYAWTPL